LCGVVAFDDLDLGGFELAAHRRVYAAVAARYAMPCSARQLRDAAHESSANAEDMNVHVPNPG
jgi:hypothetical protein